jgi:hypothetical protein
MAVGVHGTVQHESLGKPWYGILPAIKFSDDQKQIIKDL